MILHLVDDEKFIDFIIRQFDQTSSTENKFYVVVDKANKPLRYIKKQERVTRITGKDLLKETYIKNLSEADLVVIHLLTQVKARFILKYQSVHTKFLWIAWGTDFYDIHPELKNGLLLEKTRRVKQDIEEPTPVHTLIRSGKDLIKHVAREIGLYKDTYWYQQKAVNRINYLASVIYDDYVLIKDKYKAAHLKYVEFRYGHLEPAIYAFNEKRKSTANENIFIGNSATFSNNHIEILDILSTIQIGNRKVYVPLSYGNVEYASRVISYGREKLGKNLVPITEFLDLTEYYKILADCNYFIGNYRRQQGLGNINRMLYFGAKVFLRPENPAYEFLKRSSVVVHKIEDLEKKGKDAFTPLTESQIAINRNFVEQRIGEDQVREYYRKFCKLAE